MQIRVDIDRRSLNLLFITLIKHQVCHSAAVHDQAGFYFALSETLPGLPLKYIIESSELGKQEQAFNIRYKLQIRQEQ